MICASVSGNSSPEPAIWSRKVVSVELTPGRADLQPASQEILAPLHGTPEFLPYPTRRISIAATRPLSSGHSVA
jgi:hypothetical protein